MKKKVLLLLIVLVLCSFQNMVFDIKPNKDCRNLGTAKNLNGKTYVLLLFVSYKTYPNWKPEETKIVYNQIYQAFNWIKLQSKGYGVNNDFSLFVLGEKESIKMDYMVKGPFQGDYSNQILNNAMYAAGYSKNFNFFDYVKQQGDYNNCLVLVCSNSSGRGYALPENLETYQYNVKYGYNPILLEGCMLFQYYTDGQPLYASTIAHEILHLFGAADLYSVYSDSQLSAKCEKYFPNSIMHRIGSNFDNLEIDPLTAFLTGLSNKYESWYQEFINAN